MYIIFFNKNIRIMFYILIKYLNDGIECIYVKSIRKLVFLPFCLISLVACTPKPDSPVKPVDEKSIGIYSQSIKRGFAELQKRNDPKISEVSKLIEGLDSNSGIEDLKQIDDLIVVHLKNTKIESTTHVPIPNSTQTKINTDSGIEPKSSETLSDKAHDVTTKFILNAANTYSNNIMSSMEESAEKQVKEGVKELIALNDPKIDEIYIAIQKLEGMENRQSQLIRINQLISAHKHELLKPDRLAASSEKNKAFFNEINQIRQSAGAQAQ